MVKVAIVTCYKIPDYIRARTLRAGLNEVAGVQSIVIKNTHTGFLRYPEILLRILYLRLKTKPDIYIVTFRGYEILPLVLLVAGSRPVVLDELIDPLLVVSEHRQQRSGTLIGKLMGVWALFGGVYYFLLRHCRMVIADTTAQAKYSAQHSGLEISRFSVIPVSTDEELFKPAKKGARVGKTFKVFYYGTMQPLHGLEFILEAALLLKDQSHIEFHVVGNGPGVIENIEQAQKQGAHIVYEPWVEFEKLPELIHASNVCLGGPFGNTIQSAKVITGKTYQFLACGLPTIVGQNEATELFIDRKNCLLVPQGNAHELATTILWAESHIAELEQIGSEGRKLYETAFSSSAVTGALKDLIARL